MNVKDTLKEIRETDARLAEARRALAAAEERRSAIEDNLAAALAEGNEPNETALAEAGGIAVEVEARRRAHQSFHAVTSSYGLPQPRRGENLRRGFFCGRAEMRADFFRKSVRISLDARGIPWHI